MKTILAATLTVSKHAPAGAANTEAFPLLLGCILLHILVPGRPRDISRLQGYTDYQWTHG